MINYKFNEEALINELKEYVDSTYDQHYSKNNFQSSEFIMDCGHGMGFFLGNVLKYTQRYGHKDGYNRKDLLKVLHYALLALNQHDEQESEDTISISLTDYDSTFDILNYSMSDVYNNDNMWYNGDSIADITTTSGDSDEVKSIHFERS